MAFEMQVVSHAPLTGETDCRRAAAAWFDMIGYTARKGPDHGISHKLFFDCFLLHPTHAWTIEELAAACETTMPSIYRHLNKLKDLDIVEDLHVGDGDARRRAYRIRYGDLAKAWNFAEAHFRLAIENYRKTVDHLEALLREERRRLQLEGPDAPVKAFKGPSAPAAPAAPEPAEAPGRGRRRGTTVVMD